VIINKTNVPAHWETRKLKHLVRIEGGGTPSKEVVSFWDGNIPWVSPKDMKRGIIIDSEDHISAEALKASATSLIPRGNLLVVVRSGILKHSFPVAVNDVPVTINQDMKALIPKGTVNSKFLYWYLVGMSHDILTACRNLGATVDSIDVELFSKYAVMVPPIEEQNDIVFFLDRQTAKLDQLVEKKQRLIDLLREKRQALITQAVTKGLDPNVPMKDSRIEWLGEVPAHWTVSRLKPFIILNPSKQEISKFSLDTEVTFVPMEAVNESGIVDCSRIKMISECVTGYTYFRDGDVLLAKITPCFENGKAALVNGLNNGIGFGSTEFHVLRANSNIDRHYLAYIVQSDPFRKLGEASMIGAAGQKRVPESFILNFKQAYPPIDEQVEIAKFLDREISNIDKIINKLNQQITTIQEYRQALITAAVTGQIDVREKLAVSTGPIPAGKE